MKQLIILAIFLAFTQEGLCRTCCGSKAYSQPSYEKDANLHQMLPLIHQADYGFEKKVIKTEAVYYQADSTGYQPTSLKVLIFNEQGLLDKEYLRIMGDYASETLMDYKYKGQQLDSLVKTASAANFYTNVDYEHDTAGKLVKETGTGIYTNYTTTYHYDPQNRISNIHTVNKTGFEIKTDFEYKNSELYCVTQVEGDFSTDELKTKYVFYAGGKPLFSTMEGENRAVYHESDVNLMGIGFESDNSVAEVQKLLQQRAKDPGGFPRWMRQTYRQHDKLMYASESRDTKFPDWTKRYVVTNGDGRMIFRKLFYADGQEVGSTAFDLMFQMRVAR